MNIRKLSALLTSAVCLLSLAGLAQTPPPSVPLPTNAPTVDLGLEKFALTMSAVTDGDEARAAITLDYDLSKYFYVRGEVQMGPADSIVENVGTGLGFYKTINNFRLFAGIGARYSWERSEFQGTLGAGVAYQLFQDGALSKWSVYSEFRLMTPFNNDARKEPPHRELLAGVRYSF